MRYAILLENVNFVETCIYVDCIELIFETNRALHGLEEEDIFAANVRTVSGAVVETDFTITQIKDAISECEATQKDQVVKYSLKC